MQNRILDNLHPPAPDAAHGAQDWENGALARLQDRRQDKGRGAITAITVVSLVAVPFWVTIGIASWWLA